MRDEILNIAIEKGRNVANKLRDEAGDEVGAEIEFEFNHEGKTYNVAVEAYWEKYSYYGVQVTGNNYISSEELIDF